MLAAWVLASLFVISQQQQRPATPPGQGTATYPRFEFDDQPTIRFSRDSFVAFKARVAAEHRTSDAPLDAGDEAFEVIRKRVGVEGELAGLIAFEVERELVELDPWRDVFVEYMQFNEARVRGGKFKLPFGLEENTSVDNLDLAYRSMASNQLAPGRDRGVMVYGRFFSRRLNYEAGWFAADGVNAKPRADHDDQVQGGSSLGGRVVVQPARGTKSPLAGLEFGAAYMLSEVEEGLSAIRGQTALGPTYFPSDFYVSGNRKRLGLQGQWRQGPAGVKAEYITLTDERLGMSVEDTDLDPLRARGWYVTGAFVLTGEDEQDANVPKRPLFKGGIGSIELAARTEQLAFDSAGSQADASTSPRADVILRNAVRAHTVGINWHPNRWTKVQFNLIREIVDDPSRGPLPSQPGFWTRLFRVQVSL